MSILKFTDMKYGTPSVVVDSTWVGAVTLSEHGVTTLNTSAGLLYVKESVEVVQELLGWVDAKGAQPVCTATPMASLTGSTLNCTMGIWTYEPTGYAYQWMRDGVAVGENSANYVVGADDAGHSFTCVVTASNVSGTVAAPPSNAVAIPAAAPETAGKKTAEGQSTTATAAKK